MEAVTAVAEESERSHGDHYLLTTRQAAAWIGISEHRFRELSNSKYHPIPYIQLIAGGYRYYTVEILKEYLSSLIIREEPLYAK